MLADCLDGDRRFGIAYLPDQAPEDSIARGHVGCIAKIERVTALEDGRSNILVTGETRFAIERQVPDPSPYRVAEIIPYDDASDATSADVQVLAAHVRALFDRVAQAARALSDERESLPELPTDPAALSFGIASLIDLDLDKRQSLLVSRSAGERLDTLEHMLAAAVDRLEHRAGVHERAKSNGHGPETDG